MSSKKKLFYRSLIVPVVFILCLLMPHINAMLHVVPDFESAENRSLSKFPNLSLRTIDSFPHRFDEYFSDGFNLRNRFIRQYNWFKFSKLGSNPMPEKCIVGKEGFLYMGKEEMDVFLGRLSFSKEQLQDIASVLERRKRYVEALGGKFYFVICPVKQSVYPQYLPFAFQNGAETTCTDDLVHYLEKNTAIKFLDLRPILKSASDTVRVFCKTDSHWNEYGGLVAAKAVIGMIANDFPGIENVANLDSFTVTEQEGEGGNLAGLLNMKNDLREQNYQITLNSAVARLERNEIIRW